MSVAPIGLGRNPLPPEYLELLDILKQVPPAKGYSYPTEQLRFTILTLPSRDIVSNEAFPYIASFIKQGPPTTEQLDEMRRESKTNPETFLTWIKRRSNLYFPVLTVLEKHRENSPELRYRTIDHRLRELADHIVDSVTNPATYLSTTRPPAMTPEEELIVTLACAHFCHVGAFQHSALLTPDYLAGAHWSRVVKPEVSERLLHPDTDRKFLLNILQTNLYQNPERLFLHLDSAAPILLRGAL